MNHSNIEIEVFDSIEETINRMSSIKSTKKDSILDSKMNSKMNSKTSRNEHVLNIAVDYSPFVQEVQCINHVHGDLAQCEF